MRMCMYTRHVHLDLEPPLRAVAVEGRTARDDLVGDAELRKVENAQARRGILPSTINLLINHVREVKQRMHARGEDVTSIVRLQNRGCTECLSEKSVSSGEKARSKRLRVLRKFV